MDDFLSDRTPPEGRSILFLDIDGTLLDSYPGIRAGFLHALDTIGVEYPDEDFLSRLAGPPMEHTLAALGLDDATVRAGFDAYMSFTAEGGWAQAEAFPGMADFVADAKAAGYYLATASSKGEGFARRSLTRTGFIDDLDFLGAAQEYGARRTKEKVIEYVLDSVGLRGRESDVLMVGDRSYDIRGAAGFGIDAVATEWGYGREEEWRDARFRVSDADQLKEVVHDWTIDG